MLFLRPLKDGDQFQNITFSPDNLYYVALDGETLIGFCRYRKGEDRVEILEIDDGGDVNLFDGLMRAVFNFVTAVGIDRAVFAENISKERLKALFVPVDEKNCVNSLNDFLNNCRKCKMS